MSDAQKKPSIEEQRLADAASRVADWQRWGTYLPERQWGTVREDDSPDGNPWAFTYDIARYKGYRWGEDGLLGWTDRECRLCYSTSFWNGKDACLKERLFGLTNSQGNHGEDVKELYYYLDATPTHSYARGLYKYPQVAFPYERLTEVNRTRGVEEPEFELLDTGAFDGDRYFDCQIEYAKQGPDDILIRLSVTNQGENAADLTIVPTLYFRNTWDPNTPEKLEKKPVLQRAGSEPAISASHETLGEFCFTFLPDEDASKPAPNVLFAENQSNDLKLGQTSSVPNASSKDAFDRYVVHGDRSGLCAEPRGTKAAFVLQTNIQPKATHIYRLRLAQADQFSEALSRAEFDAVFQRRLAEADDFYARKIPQTFTSEEAVIARQAYAGLLWSKQFYFYVGQGATADPKRVTAQTQPEQQRNASWRNLFCRDVLSVPDKWEYPWFASWDSAFQLVSIAQIDPEFSKRQLMLFLGEDYLHPVGQLPAYEYAFSDTNPPVHAWGVLRVFEIDAAARDGKQDLEFLERAFHKLVLNFSWWVNRLDPSGNNLFGGGFLGLDNIGVFDRSALPPEDKLGQADGTAWMGFFCATMLTIALELAQTKPVYEGLLTKFFEHYIAIIDAFNTLGGSGLWDEEDGFFFDKLVAPGSPPCTLKVRSIEGIIPLYGLCILPQEKIKHLPSFVARMRWARMNRPDLASFVGVVGNRDADGGETFFVSMVQEHRLPRIAQRVFAPSEFLSPYGIRALSRIYFDEPYTVELAGKTYTVTYAPAEGDSGLFGGNSNWRGPVWFPVNVLLIEALDRYGRLLGDSYTVEYPTASGARCNLLAIAGDLAARLGTLFIFGSNGRRPCHGGEDRYARHGPWEGLVLFHEYFSGDTGRGVGASHQTGWTGFVPLCLETAHRLNASTRVINS